jgi:hypothetical protein
MREKIEVRRREIETPVDEDTGYERTYLMEREDYKRAGRRINKD